MSWQPIDTAPKDGTVVLLCWGGLGVSLGFYHEQKEVEFGEVVVRKAGWSAGANLPYLPGAQATPTHWMPLPDPPSLSEPKAKLRAL